MNGLEYERNAPNEHKSYVETKDEITRIKALQEIEQLKTCSEKKDLMN
jgi:hypothetical protein